MRIEYDNGYYTGDVDHNEERHGYGTYVWNSGDKYVGNWFHGEQHGNGKYTWPSGNCYEGQWKNGEMHGKGTRTFASGCKYIGEFKNDEICGHGTWYNSDGSTLEGEWSDSENAKNVIFKHGSNFDRGRLINNEFISELDQWTTNGSSYCAATHSNNNTVEHGSYHRNDRSFRGALNHIHFNDGSELLIEDCGDKLKLTMKKNGLSRVEYASKASCNPNYAEFAKRLFGM